MLTAVACAVHPVGHVFGHVPDARVVLLDQRQQAGDRRRVRGREVDVAAPDPVAALLQRAAAQADRLRVVDDHHVPLALQALGVDLVDLVEDLPLLVAQRLLGPLQRVVEELGRVEELLLAEDHVPVRVEADVAHQRHQRVEDLGDAAAESGGADVQHPLALQRLGELADLLRQLFADDVGVVGEGLVAEGDFLKQGWSSTPMGGDMLSQRRSAAASEAAWSGRLPSVTLTCSSLAVAEDRQRHLVAGLVGGDRAARSSGLTTSWPSTCEDHVAAGAVLAGLEAEFFVAALEAGLRRPGRPGRLRRPARRRSVSSPSLCGELRIERLAGDADVGVFGARRLRAAGRSSA